MSAALLPWQRSSLLYPLTGADSEAEPRSPVRRGWGGIRFLGGTVKTRGPLSRTSAWCILRLGPRGVRSMLAQRKFDELAVLGFWPPICWPLKASVAAAQILVA